MLHANELMVGDWVSIKSDIEPDDAYWLHDMQPGQALKVTEILSYGINPDWYGGEINDWVPEEAIEPVPLTPEILEKNGFRECVWFGQNAWSRDYLIFNSVTICIDGRDGGLKHFGYLGYQSMIVIDYVHQLQHALRLCGISLDIVI